MKYLLDTHALLWILEDNENLSHKVKRIYLNNANQIFLSVVSLWEMTIKISLNKLSLSERLEKFVDRHVIGNNIRLLNVTAEHIYPVETFASYHRDPFERLLISQSMKENIPIISKDDAFDKYPIKRIW
ncbi:type II toxin-antitoxin system VapC family toxin [candidate division KSB1 bacterium]|nr:type II toxin-antitoxin system VapC family toxin [candidate division KSB1 bacterium]NIR69203.1 type II toxin-antitoxin system VapC family toxin [candidate division KSB1 bacterium]NIS27380.1 type II toxin-antitoxin system VapC family toxin [candidate division KSB1 bacterium]NIT74205.1 type II toxin-antitoxin system VapC family toxin [candidate division KSB1 bacterium]NIU28097.1 type II toxin-antitoxin system VapC family toxin [candidate division KSB1 bacterium]